MGKKGSIDFFSPHRIRKFNASAIEDTDFANHIQGRKPNKIRETYFKKNIDNVREEYKKHMHKFNIYAHYDVMINSEAYKKMKNQIEDERRKHEEENRKLREEYEHKISQLELQNSSLSGQINNIETQMNSLTRANDLTTIINYARTDNLVNEHNLMPYVVEIYQEIIEKNENFYPSRTNMDDIIAQAHNRKILGNARNVGFIGKSTKNFDEIYNHITLIAKQMIERRGFILTTNLNQELESQLMSYAQQIDNEVGSNGDWQELVENSGISHIVAEVTKSIM